MFASTGTNGSPDGGATVEEGRKSPVKSDESDGTTAAQSRVEGTDASSDYFEAGQFGTYVSIFILVVGESPYRDDFDSHVSIFLLIRITRNDADEPTNLH